jgi:hypothetical protein
MAIAKKEKKKRPLPLAIAKKEKKKAITTGHLLTVRNILQTVD